MVKAVFCYLLIYIHLKKNVPLERNEQGLKNKINREILNFKKKFLGENDVGLIYITGIQLALKTV